MVMEVNCSSGKGLIIYVYSDLSKCAVFAQVLGQIQHTCAFEVYNMEIKVHFPFDLAYTKYNKYNKRLMIVSCEAKKKQAIHT